MYPNSVFNKSAYPSRPPTYAPKFCLCGSAAPVMVAPLLPHFAALQNKLRDVRMKLASLEIAQNPSQTSTMANLAPDQRVEIDGQMPTLSPVAPALAQSGNVAQNSNTRAKIYEANDMLSLLSKASITSDEEVDEIANQQLQEVFQRSKVRSGYISPKAPESEIYSDSEDDESEQEVLPEFIAPKKSVFARVNAPVVPKLSRDPVLKNVAEQSLSNADSAPKSGGLGIFRLRPPLPSAKKLIPMSFPMQDSHCTRSIDALKPRDIVSSNESQLKLDENPSMVFIYDIKDLTQLSLTNIEQIRQRLPDFAVGSIALYLLIDRVMTRFFDGDNDKVSVKEALSEEYMKLIKEAGEEGKTVISHELVEKLELTKAKEEICGAAEKVFQKQWKNAKQCLAAIRDKSLKNTYQNVVLCDGHVGIGAAELLLTGLVSEVPLENVISTENSTKEAVLKNIQQEYGDACLLVLITSNSNTSFAAKKLDIPVWSIDYKDSVHFSLYNDSFEEFFNVQRDHLLN